MNSAPQRDKNTSEFTIDLSDGRQFYLTDRCYLGAAQFLRFEIFKRQRYFRKGFELKPSDNIIDIGANMGMFTAWAVPQIPNGKLIAIEPTASVECLELNRKKHGWTNVEVLNLAVGDKKGEMDLWHYPGFNIISHPTSAQPANITYFLINLAYFRFRKKASKITVPCVSFDSVMDGFDVSKVDFLKIDCEGAEYEIFRGLSKHNWKRINKIALEFHEYGEGQSAKILIENLRCEGFEVVIRKPLFEYYLMKYGEIWAWRKDRL